MPAVICEVENGETMICESGAMSWMSPNMHMETSGGGVGKVFGRMFTGEPVPEPLHSPGAAPEMIAFASSFPGCIRAYEIHSSTPIVVPKRGFPGIDRGVDLSVHF